MCHNKILDFVSGRKATGIMPILLYAILLSVTPKKMTDDSELSYVMDVEKPCVDLYVRESSKGQRQREEKMKRKKKKEKRTGVKGGSKEGGGEENRSRRHNSNRFPKMWKKKKERKERAQGLQAIGIFSPNFLYFFFLSSFSGKNGVNVAHTQSTSLSTT